MMKNQFTPYRILFAFFVLFGIAAAAGYFYFLRPRHLKLREGEKLMAEKSADILSRNWPLAPDRLNRLRQNKQRRLNWLSERLAETQEMAVETFAEAISSKFGIEAVEDPVQFINFATRLDYQEYYSEIIDKWEQQNVILHPLMLNLAEDSVSSYIYRLILQLWTVDTVLDLVTQSGLNPVVRPLTLPRQPGEGRENEAVTVPASQVALQPIREYRFENDDDRIFLLEFPVKITVRGTSRELYSLFEQLAESGYWIAINSVEIRKQPMRRLAQPDDRLEVGFELSAFYPLKTEESIRFEPKGELVPRGV